MKNKLIAIFVALLMLSLASCGFDGSTDETTVENEVSTTSDTETTAPETETTASETQPQSDVSITEIGDAVAEEFGESFRCDADIDSETLEATYGIKPEWVKEAYAKVAMVTMWNDHFIGIHANPDCADDVEAALTDYKDYYIENSFQYPMNEPKTKAMRVYRNGDYVFLILLGDYDDTLDDDGNYEAAVEANQRAVDIIDQMLGE